MQKSLFERLQCQSKNMGESIAVFTDDESLSYRQLWSSALAFKMKIKSAGLGANNLVAIYGERSTSLVAAIIGVNLCEAAYTIIEINGSIEEHLFRLSQIQPDLVLIDPKIDFDTHAITIGLARINLASSIYPELDSIEEHLNGLEEITSIQDLSRPAYVLYTSGSSGSPKGVVISHANIAHYCTSIVARLNIPKGLTYAHVSTLAADLGNTCLFLSLWTGGRLYLVSDSVRRDPLALVLALKNNSVNILKITPTHWSPVLTMAERMVERLRLRYLILGGESLSSDIACRSILSGACNRLINHYGPTETTIGVCVHDVKVDEIDAERNALAIGRPIGQTQLLIKNPNGEYVASGKGELFIGGPSVGIGYRNMDGLTDEKFLAIPEKGRFYSSGDIVETDNQGNFHFLGRVDRQVKANGYRIELEHVERSLRKLNGIECSVTILHRHMNRDYLLCAFNGEREETSNIRDELSNISQGFMAPNFFLKVNPFPITANGKADVAVITKMLIERFEETHSDSALVETLNTSDDISQIFAKYLKDVKFNQDSNFFDLGADSLDAIGLIMELQLKGYPVTAHGFLSNPSVQGLLEMIKNSPDKPAQQKDIQQKITKLYESPLSPAQAWFYKQDLHQKNSWTQAMVFQSKMDLDIEAVTCAAKLLLIEHPILMARFESNKFRISDLSNQQVVTNVNLPAELLSNMNQFERIISDRYKFLEGLINIEKGALFKIEIYKCPGQGDRLLIFAHHLAVDMISWRIILDDLMRFYASSSNLGGLLGSHKSSPFSSWVNHINFHREDLKRDLLYWNNNKKNYSHDDYGLECDSHCIWLKFSRSETSNLYAGARAIEIPLDRLILTAFAYHFGKTIKRDKISVDVESHGRITFSPDIDVSRSVGYFTSTFPITFDVNLKLMPLSIFTNELMNVLPNLGVGYSMFHEDLKKESSPICFNYLGPIHLGMRNDWGLHSLPLNIGNLRGELNRRLYDFKLTGRVSDGQLILDLNYPGQLHTSEEVMDFLSDIKQSLLNLMNINPEEVIGNMAVSRTNSAGMLWNVPSFTEDEREIVKRREYEVILLTGASGFIGIHILRELLLNTDAKIYCLLRSHTGEELETRLEASWNRFFSIKEYVKYRDRLEIYEADVNKLSLGLRPAEWDLLGEDVDAIFHFAADTKLVGNELEAQSSIVFSTKEIIRLAEYKKYKTLHFMSTLAVAGINNGSSPLAFNENTFDIGQEFLNGYERAKFEAEGLVREFAYKGGEAFIYRSGNVSGDSVNGAFQINASSNRWIQCIQSVLSLGKYASGSEESVVLSAVDKVSKGIVAIATYEGFSGGVFHVESTHEILLDEVYKALSRLGCDIQEIKGKTQVQLLEESTRLGEPEIALGYFWLTRPKRNINFNSEATNKILESIGIKFEPLDGDWLLLFFERLLNEQSLRLITTAFNDRKMA